MGRNMRLNLVLVEIVLNFRILLPKGNCDKVCVCVCAYMHFVNPYLT